jgi:hypothetical protein
LAFNGGKNVLQKSNEKVRAEALRFFREVDDYAIFLLDRQGNVETWNRGAELDIQRPKLLARVTGFFT